VLARLNAALKVALKDPDLIRKQEALGLAVTQDGRLDPAGHRNFLESEKARWSRVIKDAGEYAD
jgi:tripartite-type tricarboxylate transporter receptor subunit TctC